MIVVAIVAVWTAVLAWPGQAPLWLLVLLTQVVGFGGPGLDDRLRPGAHLQPRRRGWRAPPGIINQAGFAASLVLVMTVGLILDWRTPGARRPTPRTPSAGR